MAYCATNNTVSGVGDRSCLTNLLTSLEEWTKLYDEGIPFDALYLDFKKAFDSVPHCKLIYKLRQYGMSGRLICWLEDFYAVENKEYV